MNELQIETYKAMVSEDTKTMKSTDLHKFVFEATGKFKELKTFHSKLRDVLGSQIDGGKMIPSFNPNKTVAYYIMNEVQCNMIMASIDVNHLELMAQVFVAVKYHVEELTPFQLVEKAYQLEAKRHEHTNKLLKLEKSITKTLEIELDSVTDTDGLLDMKSFSMLVTSRTHGVNFGRTRVYMALRSCKLVGDDTRPTQYGLTSYLEVKMVEGNNGIKYPKTFVIGHKFEKLLSLIIRKVREDDILNYQLGFPFGQ